MSCTFSGQPYAVINNNVPYFDEEDKQVKSFENYSDLDLLGRCGVAYACVSRELMPTEERGEIGSIKPSGWQNIWTGTTIMFIRLKIMEPVYVSAFTAIMCSRELR